MHQLNFDDVLDKIVEQNPRYRRDAYLFLREGLDFTQKAIARAHKNKTGHISVQELLHGLRDYALALYGPMTATVLEEWGITSCEDFGHMVFLMVENNLLRKTDQDSIDDFRKGYSFDEAFRKPFRPAARVPVLAAVPEPSRVEQN